MATSPGSIQSGTIQPGSIQPGAIEFGTVDLRLVHVDRSSTAHEVTDVAVASRLYGSVTGDSRLVGEDVQILATDAQKRAICGLVDHTGVGSAEDFGLKLARYFVDEFDVVQGAREEISQRGWARIEAADGRPHDHAFRHEGGEIRTAVVIKQGGEEIVFSGLTALNVLRTTGGESHGFPEMPVTSGGGGERILSTELTARWRHLGTDVDWDKSYPEVRRVLLENFAETTDLPLRQMLHAMGEAVLDAQPGIAEIRLSMPHQHHFLIDLSAKPPGGPDKAWQLANSPLGPIEAVVVREDMPAAVDGWAAVAGFA